MWRRPSCAVCFGARPRNRPRGASVCPKATDLNSESERRSIMPRGDKSKYTDKQDRKADHIAESYEQRGVPEKEAERRAWATVNKESGGGKKSGSGRGRPESHASSRKGGGVGGRVL